MDSLEPLEKLATETRAVILFDQLGCGASDRPSNPDLWTIPLFVRQIGAVVRGLGLESYHLVGHSFGGCIAMEFATGRPKGLRSLTVASSPGDAPFFRRELARLCAEMTTDVRNLLEEGRRDGFGTTMAHKAAEMAFYRAHVCRLDPWPHAIIRTMKAVNKEIYRTLWGVNDFTVTGTVKDWSILQRLPQVSVPVLVTCGKFDEVTPACAAQIAGAVRNAELEVFEKSSHFAFFEEEDGYLCRLNRFLNHVESSPTWCG
jgi:proline-specific peptidase